MRRIFSALDEKLADLSARLNARRRDPAGRGAQTLERDAGIRRLTAELTTLRRFGLDLCIGHYAAAGTVGNPGGDGAEPMYVGRIGLTDAAGTPLLVDWRTPAAEPFFAATLADPMGVRYRRRYRWAGGRIVDYWDEIRNDDDDVAARASLDDQSAFVSSLSGARTGRMRDVLSTIQADQDAIIRADSRGALVVDGGPGTGKTVVALHRAAFLLHADSRVGARRGNLLLVGPHRPYLDYGPGLSVEEIRLLQRPDPAAWTSADLPLLDAARYRLGDADRARSIQRRHAERAAEWSGAAR